MEAMREYAPSEIRCEMSSRLKREDCKRTKHDSVFSKWQILIGPTDWEDHASGKDGVERYRIHNLPPSSSCPGAYELGIAEIPRDGRKSREHASDGIVVVYLGQADSVRSRLQQYGRAGSHLERGILLGCANNYSDSCLGKGPGLFKEVFTKGYAIFFRWAPMIDKKEAEKIEGKLLSKFDYAWNTRANGASRREDVLQKIGGTVTGQPIPKVFKNLCEWKQSSFNKKVGINIRASVLPDKLASSNYLESYLIPLVRKVSRTQPRLNGGEIINSEHDICGVAIGDGSVCRRKPVIRNKRCILHKGKRITWNSHITGKEVLPTIYNSSLASVSMEDGSLCMELPCNGTLQYKELEGQKVSVPKLQVISNSEQRGLWPIDNKTEDELSDVEPVHGEDYCGVFLGDGNVCRSKPFPGRKRCEDHKGMRVTGIISMITRECSITKGISSDTQLDPFDNYEICGVFLGDGKVCQNEPFRGRKRCEDHKGMRINSIISRTTRECSITKGISYDVELYPCEQYQVCGVFLANGNVCQNEPFRGRERCEDHKGMRINSIILRTTRECSIPKGISYDVELYPCEQYQVCGVFLANGNVCQRKPIQGRKRCAYHKGMRVS